MKEIIVNINQSLSDIAVQEYGSTDGQMQLILDNPGKCNFYDPIPVGTKLKIDETKVINRVVVDYMKKKNIKPTTAVEVGGGFDEGFDNGFNI